MEIKTKTTEILDKHLGHEQVKYLFDNNEPLWDDIIDAVNEALTIPVVNQCVPYQKCPKCDGQGIVSKPPHIAGDVLEWSSTSVSHTCNVCNGSKIIPKAHCC